MVILLHSSAHSYDTSASCVTRLPSLNSGRVFFQNGIFYSFEWGNLFWCRQRFCSPFTHIILDHLPNGRKCNGKEKEKSRRTAKTIQMIASYWMRRHMWRNYSMPLFYRFFTIVFFCIFCVYAIDRVASMPNTGVEEEYYRLRHFSITGKGVVNRGDSLKSRRSRSNNSVASSNSR